jgi:hypothetical protein
VTDQGQCARARQELGVYVLGAIEPAQRAQTGRHLAACPQCRTELAGLAGLPALLRKVRYTPEKWGTELEVRVAGVAAGTRCQLRVTGPHGQQAPAGGGPYRPGSRSRGSRRQRRSRPPACTPSRSPQTAKSW